MVAKNNAGGSFSFSLAYQSLLKNISELYQVFEIEVWIGSAVILAS